MSLIGLELVPRSRSPPPTTTCSSRLGYVLNTLYAALMAHTLLALPDRPAALARRALGRRRRLRARAARPGAAAARSRRRPRTCRATSCSMHANASLADLGQTLLRGALLAIADRRDGDARRTAGSARPARSGGCSRRCCGAAPRRPPRSALSLAGQLADLPERRPERLRLRRPVRLRLGADRLHLRDRAAEPLQRPVGRAAGRAARRRAQPRPQPPPRRARQRPARPLARDRLLAAGERPGRARSGRGATSTPTAPRSRCRSPAAAAPSRSSSTTAAASRR